ncbi:MAG: hypothetical protein KIT84_10505 [Labilithrix sp.]|nr:hypothetical protein [Labilithrix sp.]MCW5811436.1 hypothetical protein [Labilithrix sp.]
MTPPHGIDLTAYAAVSADLAEGDRTFSEVLAARDLTDAQWMDATLYWGQRMGEHAIAFSDAFAQAQDAKRPLVSLSVAEWFALERAIDTRGLPKALRERSLGLADYSRLIRHWAKKIATDSNVQRELADLGSRDGGV